MEFNKKKSFCVASFNFLRDGCVSLNNQFHCSLLLQKKIYSTSPEEVKHESRCSRRDSSPASRCLMSLLKSHLPDYCRQVLENLIASCELSLMATVGGLRHLRHLFQKQTPLGELFHQANSFYLIRKTFNPTLILASETYFLLLSTCG